MFELGDNCLQDSELKRMLATQKNAQYLEKESEAFGELMATLDVSCPPGSLTKAASASIKDGVESKGIYDSFGFEDLGKFSKTYSIPTSSAPLIDLDGLEKNGTSHLAELCARLMKAERKRMQSFGKSTGSPSEEMMNFFERYQHLFHKTVQDAIRGAIKALDFPLFSRLMSEGLASSL